MWIHKIRFELEYGVAYNRHCNRKLTWYDALIIMSFYNFKNNVHAYNAATQCIYIETSQWPLCDRFYILECCMLSNMLRLLRYFQFLIYFMISSTIMFAFQHFQHIFISEISFLIWLRNVSHY